MSKPPPNYTWRIIHLPGTGGPAETLRYVKAPDAETAIKKVVEEFKITNVQVQQPLIAERVDG
jgi:hypothetical protein